MSKQRIKFSKTGRAKFTSHLDLMRSIHRAFLRAGVELRYSEGYNPHPYISVAMPLSVGTESICELLDFEPLGSAPPDLASRLNAVLPEGIAVLDTYVPARKFNEIAWVEVRGRLFYGSGAVLQKTAERLTEFLSGSESLVITKKTKRGERELDVREHIISAAVFPSDGGELIVSARLSASEPVINTGDLLSAMHLSSNWQEPELAVFRRVELYDANHKVFK